MVRATRIRWEIIGGMSGNNTLVEHSSLTTTNYASSPSVLAEETRNIGTRGMGATPRIECFRNSVRNSSEYRFACSRTLIAVEYARQTSIKVNRFHATYSSTFSSYSRANSTVVTNINSNHQPFLLRRNEKRNRNRYFRRLAVNGTSNYPSSSFEEYDNYKRDNGINSLSF